MLNKQCLICKFIPPKLYKHMRLTTRLYGIFYLESLLKRSHTVVAHIQTTYNVMFHTQLPLVTYFQGYKILRLQTR